MTDQKRIKKRESIADLWYVTDIESNKLDELESDPHVNLGFYDTKLREWVSVSGRPVSRPTAR